MRALAPLSCLLLLPALAAAATWRVTQDAPTIQAAVDSAAAGDTVLVAPGEYVEHVAIGKSLVLIGETGNPEDVIVDGGGEGTCLAFGVEDQDMTLDVTGLTVRNAQSGMAQVVTGGCDLTLTDCVVEGCHTGLGHIGMSLRLERCLVQDNEGGAIWQLLGSVTILDSVFRGNGGRVLDLGESRVTMQDCLVVDNGDGFRFEGPFTGATFTGCTIVGNGLDGGTVFSIAPSYIVELENTIVVGNGTVHVGLDVPAEDDIRAVCTDIWGNENGDWTGVIADQLGRDGNLSADPRFCDPEAGDYHLGLGSPCLPGEGDGCGLIGLLGAGECEIAAPYLAAVEDVAGDQGGQVRLRWWRSGHDRPGSTYPVTGYAIWRRIDGTALATKAGESAVQPLAVQPARAYPPGNWDYVTTVPARGEDLYATVVPTLCDSSDLGICWSACFVSALTDDPLLYFDSSPDSGYSVDDIAPPTPAGLAIAYAAEGNRLSWQPCGAEDLRCYRVYTGESEAPFPGSATPVAVEGTSWTDDLAASPLGAWQRRYWVVSVDVHGNESLPADGQGAEVTGLEPPDASPAFGLLEARPNPFNPVTRIAFGLAATGPVELAIFDLQGRLVRSLLRGRSLEPGRHEAEWDGRDDGGRGVPSGAYLCRLQAGGRADSRRLLLLK